MRLARYFFVKEPFVVDNIQNRLLEPMCGLYPRIGFLRGLGTPLLSSTESDHPSLRQCLSLTGGWRRRPRTERDSPAAPSTLLRLTELCLPGTNDWLSGKLSAIQVWRRVMLPEM
jgi:hypothetical protein